MSSKLIAALCAGACICGALVLAYMSRGEGSLHAPPLETSSPAPVPEMTLGSDAPSRDASPIDVATADAYKPIDIPESPVVVDSVLPSGPLKVAVVYRVNRNPAPGAHVRIVSRDTATGAQLGETRGDADARGLFLSNPLLGSLTIIASTDAHDYAEISFEHQVPSVIATAHLELEALVTIAGVALGPKGEAAARVRITGIASEAIAGADVVTDEFGMFEFHDWIPNVLSTLSFRSERYGDAHVTLEAKEDGSWRADGLGGEWHPPYSRLTVTLASAKTIHGRVVDSVGEPVAGAQIRASGVIESSPLFAMREAVNAASDSNGVFHIKGLRSDIYHYIMCDSPGRGAAVRYSGADQQDDDLGDVILVPPHSVSGRIVDRWANPVSGAHVELLLSDASSLVPDSLPGRLPSAAMNISTTATLSEEGRFVIKGPVTRDLVLTAKLGRRDLWSGRVNLEDGDVDLGDVRSNVETSMFTGWILDASGSAVQDAHLDILDDSGQWWASAESRLNGRFRFSVMKDPFSLAAVVLRGAAGEPIARWQVGIDEFPVSLRIE